MLMRQHGERDNMELFETKCGAGAFAKSKRAGYFFSIREGPVVLRGTSAWSSCAIDPANVFRLGVTEWALDEFFAGEP
jgi:hypothetical protein